MPILKVMLNKLSSDWQVARAVLEDGYKAIDTTSTKIRTRYEFVAHLLDVHRMSCAVCPNPGGLGSDRDTAVGGSAAPFRQRMRKFLSASTQTTDRSNVRLYVDAPDRNLDLHVPDNNDDGGNININEMAFPLAQTFNGEDEELQADVNTREEKPSNEKGIKQEHIDAESIRKKNPQDLADKESNLERTIQLSYLLIKEEGASQEYCDIDVDNNTCESASHQRPEEAIPTQDSRSDLLCHFERPNQVSNLHIKQEGAFQEHCDVHVRNVSASQQRPEKAIPTQHIESDLQCHLETPNQVSDLLIKQEGASQEHCDVHVDMDSSRNEATSHHRQEEAVPTHDIGSDGKSFSENISESSRSTHVSEIRSPEGTSQDPFPADGNTISGKIIEPSRSIHVGDIHRPEGSSQDPCPADGKAILENVSESSRSSHVTSDIGSPEGSSEDPFPAGMDSDKKVKNTTRSDRRKPVQCPTCNKKYTCKSDFLAHQRKRCGAKSHSETKALPGENPYQCLKCPKKFTTKDSLKTHLRIHTREKPFPCSVCSKRFPQTGELKSHMRSHTGEKPYECSFCARKFSYSIDLSRHIQTHTGKKPFHCVICYKTFSRHDRFSCHMRMHRGEKPYQCNRCSYRCFEKRSLKDHMTKHTGETPYQCSSCNKSYSRIDTLRRHAKIHLEGKHFKCFRCNKAFTRKDHLDCHLKKKNLCSRFYHRM